MCFQEVEEPMEVEMLEPPVAKPVCVKPPAPKPASPPALRCARITCNNPKQLEPLALLSLQSTVPSLASFHGPYHPFKTDLYKNLAL